MTLPVTPERGANEIRPPAGTPASGERHQGRMSFKCSEKAEPPLRPPWQLKPSGIQRQRPRPPRPATAFMSDHNHDALTFCALLRAGRRVAFPRVTVQYWAIIVRSLPLFSGRFFPRTPNVFPTPVAAMGAGGLPVLTFPSLSLSASVQRRECASERARTCAASLFALLFMIIICPISSN